MPEPQTPTQVSTLTDPTMNDTRYHITSTFIRLLVFFIATYGIAWLGLHEPTFHDDTYTGADFHCTPVFKPGFGSTESGVTRHDTDAWNASQAYLDDQPDESYSEASQILDAAWRDGCIAARENREALIVALTAATLGVFFAIPKKIRIPLPIQRHPNSEDGTAAPPHGSTTTPTHSEPPTTADPARFAPRPSSTPNHQSEQSADMP